MHETNTRRRRTKAELVRDWRQRQKATDPTYLARERERVRAYRAAAKVQIARAWRGRTM